MTAPNVLQHHRVQRSPQSLFPSPLWGGVRGGGESHDASSVPPSPPLPHKGGGSERAQLCAPEGGGLVLKTNVVIARSVSDEAIQSVSVDRFLDCFAPLAMTTTSSRV